MPTAVERLAERIVAFDGASMPADAVERAKLSVLDQVGVQLIGSTMAWNDVIYRVASAPGGVREATVIRHGVRLPASSAAFINATFGQGCELDDGLRDEDGNTGGHAGAMTTPVALALAERAPLAGAEVLAAIVVGYETAYRLGQGMQGSHRRGFHNQSVIGPFAATAVASRLLRLDARTTAHALAIAGSQLSGIQEFDRSGGESKRMHAGLATRAGIQSADLARAGLTAPMTVLEGKRGVLWLYAAERDATALDRAIDRFGTDLGIRRAGHKLLPVVSNLQSPILLLMGLMRDHGLRARDVARIDVAMATHSVEHGASIAVPQDAMSAQVSLAFSLALRLVKGTNDLSAYADPAMWHDGEIVRLARLVHAERDDARFAGANDRGCVLRVTLTDGRVLETHEEFPKGQPENPLTRAELEEKFRRLASAVVPREAVERALDHVDRLDRGADPGGLVPLLVEHVAAT